MLQQPFLDVLHDIVQQAEILDDSIPDAYLPGKIPAGLLE